MNAVGMNKESQFQNNIPTDHNSYDKNEKIVGVLNALIQINNDRIEEYGFAATETDESDLQKLFNGMVAKSHMLNHQLANEVRKYGGQPTESTTTLGKAFRLWMDFKATLTDKDRKAILISCESGEDAVQYTYADAIKKGSGLPSDIIQLITEQKAQLNQDHIRVKSLSIR